MNRVASLLGVRRVAFRPVGRRLQSNEAINVSGGAKQEAQLVGGLPRKSSRPPPAEEKVPFVAGALGAAGLIPFLAYGLSHDDNDDQKPRVDRLLERVEGYLHAPDAFKMLKAGNQLGARVMLENYAAIILTFMAAVHWGVATVTPAAQGRAQLFLVSNFFPVAAWGILNARQGLEEAAAKAKALPPSAASQVSFTEGKDAHVLPHRLFAALFVLVHLFDEVNARKGILPPWYSKLRVPLTTAVVASLLASARFATPKSKVTGL